MQKCTLFCVILLSLSMSAQEVQLSWNKDLNIATELAKSESKPILVYFTKSDKDCQQFYGDFFKKPTFSSLSENFVLLMMDGANNDIKSNDISIMKQRRMMMHYNKTSSFPAVLVLDQNGQAMGEIFIPKNQDQIMEYWSFLATL